MTSLYITWNLDPEIIAGTPLRYYGLLFIAGIALAYCAVKRMLPATHLTPKDLERLSLFTVIGIFIGARLGHCLFYEPDYFLSRPVEMLLPLTRDANGAYRFTGYAGLASHGGVIGAVLALLLYAWTAKRSFITVLDLASIAAPLAGCFIRLANLANSEIIGTPTTAPWAFIFTRVDMLPRHPAQLYEAIIYLLIWLFNRHLLYRRFRGMIGTGFFTGWSMLLVFTTRFLIEFIKERQVAFETGMTLDMGQWLSIPFIIIAITLILRAARRRPPAPLCEAREQTVEQ